MKNLSLLFSLLFITACSSLTGKPETVSYDNQGKPRKIVIFADGTNNDRDSRTNVRRLYELISNQDRLDIAAYYDPGVGTDWRKLTGSALGVGIDKNVMQAYTYLVNTHKNVDDEIYLFGFSRGAYTSRIVSGMINTAGLINLDNDALRDFEKNDITGETTKTFNPDKLSNAIFELHNIYKHSEESDYQARLTAFKKTFPTRNVSVEAIGVWDTVDATKPTKSSSCKKHQNKHYNAGLDKNIKNVYHALSIDESRQIFWPIKYAYTCDKKNDVPKGTQLKEVWFAGVHSDVGGGYDDSRALPGLSFNWMLANLRKHNLLYSKDYRVHEDATGQMHESRENTLFEKVDKKRVRIINNGSVLHESVLKRISSVIPKPNQYREKGNRYCPEQFKACDDIESIRNKYKIETTLIK